MKISVIQKRPTSLLFALLLCFLVPTLDSCSKDDTNLNEQDTEMVAEDEVASEDKSSTDQSSSCDNPVDFVYNEAEGLVAVEFEKAQFSDAWAMKSDGNSFSGEGYMVWEGNQQLHEPGTGAATFKVNITNSGTYRFVWKSAVKIGNNGTDHNDTWLRFDDAADFYAKNGSSIVYPKDSGKTPNPEGATKDGWFKVYRSGNDLDFKWNSLTYDNNGHEIFVVFETPGIYLMEISARSSGHGIDKFVLFDESHTFEEATSSSESSTITCD